MSSENGYFDSMAEKHFAKQLPSCCFITDMRHVLVATVFVFTISILPIQ